MVAEVANAKKKKQKLIALQREYQEEQRLKLLQLENILSDNYQSLRLLDHGASRTDKGLWDALSHRHRCAAARRLASRAGREAAANTQSICNSNIYNSHIFDQKVFFLMESNQLKNPALLSPIHSACLSALLSQLTPVPLLLLLVSAPGPLLRTLLCRRSRWTGATKTLPRWHENQLKSLESKLFLH